MPIFSNQAFLSYRNSVTGSNVVTGELRDALLVTKTAVREVYTADGRITYAVSLVNTGGVSLSDLTLTDTLGAYPFGGGEVVPLDYVEDSLRYYVNGALRPSPTVAGLSPLILTGISVPAGGDAMVIYETRVNGFAPLGTDGSITNTVTVTGDGLVAPLTAVEVVNAEQTALLTITKGIDPLLVTDGDILTYTFTVQNFGNEATVATDDVTVTDTFDPVLSDITVTLDGVPLTQGVDYTYDPVTGLFSTVAGRVAVPAAVYTQDPVTGLWSVTPGEARLVVTGRV